MRLFIAICVCRVLYFIGRLIGKGTAKPGDIARIFCPKVLNRLKFDGKIICITGTNGKTTTSNMVTHILRKNGFSVINNSFGSNMLGGITTSLLTNCTFSSWQRMTSRLCTHGPITPYLPSTMLQTKKTQVYISEELAAPFECWEKVGY